MKNKTIEILQICLVVAAMVLLIVMNLFTFSPVIMAVLRAGIAAGWIGFAVLLIINRKKKARAEGS